MRTMAWMLGFAFVAGVMAFAVDFGSSMLRQRRREARE